MEDVTASLGKATLISAYGKNEAMELYGVSKTTQIQKTSRMKIGSVQRFCKCRVGKVISFYFCCDSVKTLKKRQFPSNWAILFQIFILMKLMNCSLLLLFKLFHFHKLFVW